MLCASTEKQISLCALGVIVPVILCGLCLPLQDEEVLCTDPDLLSPRKMSVSRMHSLPNDSYMFQPVRPASAPYPVEELDLSPQHHNSGIF